MNALPTGLNAYEMFAQPRKAYILLGVEPDLDCHNPLLATEALKQASLVVAMSPYKHSAALEYADVLLPVAPFTESSGTFVNAEGRIQSFNGVVRPLGDTRPGWKVLRVLGNLLGLAGFNHESSEQVRDEVMPGAGQFADGLNNAIVDLPLVLEQSEPSASLQRIAQVPIYFSDALVRRAASLQMTKDSAVPTVRLAAETIENLGLSVGGAVRVTQNAGQALLEVEVDDAVPAGCARVVAGHAMTAMLGDMFGVISVERA